MERHTPGPWFAVEYGGYHCIQAKDEYGSPDLFDLDECTAAVHNAKLGASAPKLLSVLKELVDNVNSLPDVRDLPIMKIILDRAITEIQTATT